MIGAAALSSCSKSGQAPTPTDSQPAETTAQTTPAAAVTLRADPIDGVSLAPNGEPIDGVDSYTLHRPDNDYLITTLIVTETTVVADTTFEPAETGQRVVIQIQALGTYSPRVEPCTFAATAADAVPVDLPAGLGTVTVVLIEGGTVDDLAINVSFYGRDMGYTLDGKWLGEGPETPFAGRKLDVSLEDSGDDPIQTTVVGGVVLSGWDNGSQTWAEDGKLWLTPAYGYMDIAVPSRNFEVTGGTGVITVQTDVGDFDFDIKIDSDGRMQHDGKFDSAHPIQIPAEVTTTTTTVEITFNTRNPYTGNSAPDHTLRGTSETLSIEDYLR